METNVINISELCIILMTGRNEAKDLAIEFSISTKTMIMPNYRLN